MKYGDYIYASDIFGGVGNKRRDVFMLKYPIKENNFFWIIKRSEFDQNIFTIWNHGYNEPLYAGTYLVI